MKLSHDTTHIIAITCIVVGLAGLALLINLWHTAARQKYFSELINEDNPREVDFDFIVIP